MLIAVLRLLSSEGARGEIRHDDIRSLLIVELSRLGDVISMLPAIGALKVGFPHATVHLLIDESYGTLIRNLQLDVVVHPIPKSDSANGLVQAILNARRIGEDLAINLSPSKRNAIPVLASTSRFKVGYFSHMNSLTPFLLQTKVESFGCTLKSEEIYGRENISERGWKVCRSIGINARGTTQSLRLKQGVFETVATELKRNGVLPEGPYVVIHPFSGWMYRSWDIQRFNLLAERVVQTTSCAVLFVYSREEAGKIEELRKRHEANRTVSFFSSDNLLESAVAIQGGSLFVGNDSGPLHLASMLGVRVVGLYGPAEPALTAPRNGRNSFLYKRVECSPCDQRKCIRPDDSCMKMISVDDVYSVVVASLAAVDSAPTAAHV